MFLAGYESKPAGGNRFSFKIFALSPVRTGEISYWGALSAHPSKFNIGMYYGAVLGKGADEIRRRWPTATIDITICSMSNWKTRAIGRVFIDRNDKVTVGIFPYSWRNIEGRPPILFSPLIGCRDLVSRPTASLLFPYPREEIPIIDFTPKPPARFIKPGDEIKPGVTIKMPVVGGSARCTYFNRTTEKSTASTYRLNRGDLRTIFARDKMPPLLPKEILPVSFLLDLIHCDLERVVEVPANRRTIAAQLRELIGRTKVASWTIHPTECFLIDTGKEFQVLGKDLSYEGFIVSEDKLGPISGKAPDQVKFNGLKYLRLNFSRDIAVCEGRSIIDQNGRSYEYSVFPTPFTAMKRASMLANSVRSAFFPPTPTLYG